MTKIVKWIAAGIVVLVIVIIVAVLVAPMVINFDKYKPRIETEAAKAIGRPVMLGGKIEPSVFPWIGVALSDVHLGNPPGFEQKDFVSIGLFEVRIRLLPLLLGEYEVKRFVVKNPRIILVKKKDGRANWQGLGGGSSSTPEAKTEPVPGRRSFKKETLPIKGLAVGQFAITNGNLLFIDQTAGTRHEVKNIQINLANISLKQPIRVDFSALADERPLALVGTVGPIGPEPGKSPVALDLVAQLFKQIEIRIKGRIDHPMDGPQAELSLQVPAFSLRRVITDLKQSLPIEPADEKVLTHIALSMNLTGSPEKAAISNGELILDQSHMTFTAQAKAFDKPDLNLEAALDHIDLDRYLPPPSEKKPADTATTPTTPQVAKKTDYTPLRKLVLEARVKANELKVKNVSMQNIVLKAKANNGIIRVDPLNLNLYQGRVSMAGNINVQKDTPHSEADLTINNVQAGPLLKDLLKKGLIEGALTAAISIQVSGDRPEQIRKTLNGKGELNFTDGAIVGIDLANMVRNVQSAFGLSEKPAEKPRTDFSELVVPFAITDGLARLENTRLQSPLLRVAAGGSADLVKETLDMRVEPKFVATLKGQGDTKERAGVMVPVLVSGSFKDPKFKPDLKAILNRQMPDKEALEKLIPPKEEVTKDIEKKAQELLKGLPFGPPKKE